MEKDDGVEKFRNDVSVFSKEYSDYFIAVKRKDGSLSWKTSDTTWAIGVANRYLSMTDEIDRIVERG